MGKLERYRKKINKINEKIIKLISKRNGVSLKIGEYKKNNNIPVLDLAREKEVFRKLDELAVKYNVDKKMVRSIFSEIIVGSRKLQK